MNFDFYAWLQQIGYGNTAQSDPGNAYYAELKEVLRNDVFLPEQETQLLGLSRYWNGHVREAAVRKLRHAHSPEALRAIVERLNDWVPQVRSAAVAAAEAFIRGNDVANVLPCLDAILALSRKQRADHAPFLAVIAELLRQPEMHEVVRAFFNASRGSIARYLFAQMLSWQDVDLSETVNAGARHRDVTVRMAALKACEQLDGTTALPLLNKFLDDKQPPVRKEALRMLWTKTGAPDARTALLQHFLLDKSTSVRELALWCARQAAFDVDGYLQQYMQGFPRYDATDPGALGLIGMLGARQYLPLVQSSFTNRNPAVRRAALVAWVQVCKETAGAAVVQAALESGKLSKVAKRSVTKGLVDLSAEQLTSIVETALTQRQFDKALGFINRLPLWERFEYLLRCLANAGDEAELIKLKSALEEWERVQSRSYLKPDAAQCRRLRALLGEGNHSAILLAMPRMGFALEQVGLLERT